ncbi:MAG: hypothetical protein ACYS0K_14770 [Planctomycetota bacterium]
MPRFWFSAPPLAVSRYSWFGVNAIERTGAPALSYRVFSRNSLVLSSWKIRTAPTC